MTTSTTGLDDIAAFVLKELLAGVKGLSGDGEAPLPAKMSASLPQGELSVVPHAFPSPGSPNIELLLVLALQSLKGGAPSAETGPALLEEIIRIPERVLTLAGLDNGGKVQQEAPAVRRARKAKAGSSPTAPGAGAAFRRKAGRGEGVAIHAEDRPVPPGRYWSCKGSPKITRPDGKGLVQVSVAFLVAGANRALVATALERIIDDPGILRSAAPSETLCTTGLLDSVAEPT